VKVAIDASVALKWLFQERDDEDDVDAALQLLQGVYEGRLSMVQPPHFLSEASAVMARKMGAEGKARLRLFLDIDMEMAADDGLYARAIDLSARLSHHLFDTLYHAVALETPGAVLVTADERYYRAARHERRIARLRDFLEPA
jgi:predicted nucleic acid-binding protein